VPAPISRITTRQVVELQNWIVARTRDAKGSALHDERKIRARRKGFGYSPS
jgi:hypothetical protein